MLLFSSFCTLPCNFVRFKLCNSGAQNVSLSNPNLKMVWHYTPIGLFSASTSLSVDLRKTPCYTFKLGAGKHISDLHIEESFSSFDWDCQEQEEMEDEGSPWEKAVIYKRSPSTSHVEYCTTLERLGLGKLSTKFSKSRSLVLGLRVTKSVKDHADGTPVLISLDVTRKKQKLRLDGIVRTVITLGCNRCGEPTAKSVFSNFSLLLTEEPIEYQETTNMGVIHGEVKFRAFGNSELEEEDDDDWIDLDDRLYFPPEEKEIDISKHIRDLVHVEITIDEVCDPKCKGLCLRCGVNLNSNSCQCRTQEGDGKQYRPLGGLRNQMRQR